MATDTIHALSSGRPPAAIAIIRISGPRAMAAGHAIAGDLPAPRVAARRRLRDADGAMLDDALVICFPGPRTATGEDLVELHLHGGRAVIAAVDRTLSAMTGLRPAEPGEFTRRALANGRIDLAQAEGLADLLNAESEAARRAALAMSEGAVSGAARTWLAEASSIAALVEAAIDFSDEGDVEDMPAEATMVARIHALSGEIDAMLRRPAIERLGEGVRVVLSGPRNAGKSSLFNALIGREAAIVSDIAGTTRDVIEAPVMRAGAPYLLIDTAGLTDDTPDAIEAIGVDRARRLANAADLLLWLGEESERPEGAIAVHARARQAGRAPPAPEAIATDVDDSASIEQLWREIAHRSAPLMTLHDIHFNQRQRSLLVDAAEHLVTAANEADLLLRAEMLRIARRALAALLGIDATEAMLDALFERFCIGK